MSRLIETTLLYLGLALVVLYLLHLGLPNIAAVLSDLLARAAAQS